MKKKKKNKNQAKEKEKKSNRPEVKKEQYPILTLRLKRWIGAILMALAGVIIVLAFLELAGTAGKAIFDFFDKIIGRAVYFLPFFLFTGAILILRPQKKRTLAPVLCAIFCLVLGVAGILASQNQVARQGGLLGYYVGWPLFRYFGLVVSRIVFGVIILIGALIFWEFLPKNKKDEKAKKIEQAINQQLSNLGYDPSQSGQKPKFEIKPVELLQQAIQKKDLATAKLAKKGPLSKETPQQASSFLDTDYQCPPLDLFDTKEERPSGGDVEQNASIIKKTFLNFGIDVEMTEANTGPTVTQYTLKPAEGVKLSKITTLNNDLALSLAAHPIRIEAPIPGRSLVGIEVPNKTRAVVKVGSLLGDEGFFNHKASLALALGRDVMGKPIFPAMDHMPHLLVAGATGSGKTICLNSLIISLIARNSPKVLRLVLIDPKRVEFPIYANLPHLLTPVIFNPQKAVNALNWLTGEMERRFDVLQQAGSRDIVSYNKNLKSKANKNDDSEIMPYIVLIIDELADLMMAKGKEVEAAVVRISQLARAVGIHLILATQRPSVEVITGLIKANITSRIAFQVASQIDSRTILDAAGAEKLLGRGDMLYLSSEFSKPKRIQGSFVSSAEIKKVVKFIEEKTAPQSKEDLETDRQEELAIQESAPRMAVSNTPGEIDLDDDSLSEPLYNEAKAVVMEYGKASASLLQRRLRIGYARAARILDVLEQNGVVGQQEGSRPREVYGATSRQSDDGFIDASEVESC